MVKRCDMCFQDKAQLAPVIPHAKVEVCKACGYKANQVIGFLEYHGVKLSYQEELTSTSESLQSKSGKDK